MAATQRPGTRLHDLQAWLRSQAGEGWHLVGGDHSPSDSMFVDFADIAFAHAVCDRFGCG